MIFWFEVWSQLILFRWERHQHSTAVNASEIHPPGRIACRAISSAALPRPKFSSASARREVLCDPLRIHKDLASEWWASIFVADCNSPSTGWLSLRSFKARILLTATLIFFCSYLKHWNVLREVVMKTRYGLVCRMLLLLVIMSFCLRYVNANK